MWNFDCVVLKIAQKSQVIVTMIRWTSGLNFLRVELRASCNAITWRNTIKFYCQHFYTGCLKKKSLHVESHFLKIFCWLHNPKLLFSWNFTSCWLLRIIVLLMRYSRVPNNRPRSIVNFSIFFYPGHLYSNPSTPKPPPPYY